MLSVQATSHITHPNFPFKRTSMAGVWLHKLANCKWRWPLILYPKMVTKNQFRCGSKMNQSNSDSSCSNLIKHASICQSKEEKKQRKPTVVWSWIYRKWAHPFKGGKQFHIRKFRFDSENVNNLGTPVMHHLVRQSCTTIFGTDQNKP